MHRRIAEVEAGEQRELLDRSRLRHGRARRRRGRCRVGADADRPAPDPRDDDRAPAPSSDRRRCVAGAAPSQRSWFVPNDARESTGPGTAKMSTPRSAASRAVIRLPPRSRLSTTTSSSTSAARIRLRIGKRNASGGVPGGHSEITTPRSHTCAHSAACCFGYGTSGPLPTTAIGLRRFDGECAAMGGAVDPLGQTGHDRHVSGREFEAELRGRLATSLRGVAGADDAHPTGVEGGQIATGEQHLGRTGVVDQLWRVPRIGAGDHRDAGVDTARPAPCRIASILAPIATPSRGRAPCRAATRCTEAAGRRRPPPRTQPPGRGVPAATRGVSASCAESRRALRDTPPAAGPMGSTTTLIRRPVRLGTSVAGRCAVPAPAPRRVR